MLLQFSQHALAMPWIYLYYKTLILFDQFLVVGCYSHAASTIVTGFIDE